MSIYAYNSRGQPTNCHLSLNGAIYNYFILKLILSMKPKSKILHLFRLTLAHIEYFQLTMKQLFQQLQQVLSDYLDIRNSATQGQGSTNFDEPTTDVNAYFGRKRGKPKKVSQTNIINICVSFEKRFVNVDYFVRIYAWISTRIRRSKIMQIDCKSILLILVCSVPVRCFVSCHKYEQLSS